MTINPLPTRNLAKDSAHTADAFRLSVHAVSHTHWDREWYHAASRFRQRLIPLIDALLDFPVGEGSFLLDGQAILLADYLAVRSERLDALRAQLASGELEAGPWYVLADNLIPSGEAIVRNLEAGRRVLARLGAVATNVAYCPDTFGHPAMMPAIANGFGLPVAIVWRGLGGASHPRADALRWNSADGSSVLVYHLPPDGYEVGSALPTDAAGASHKWKQLAALWRERNRTGVVLLPNGADHHARQRGRDDAMRLLARAAATDGALLIDSSLSRFAEAFTRNVHANDLPHVEGELRDSYGYTWTLQGTFGTRAAQKRTNAKLERALLRDVEPWLALAWLHGGADAQAVSPDARLTLAQLPSLLNHAWETLLQTHPHDTLCGCSTDDVASAMNATQRDVATQAAGVRVGALQLALGHNPAQSRDAAILPHPPTIVRNRTSYARGGIAEIRLSETVGDIRVGAGNSDATPLRVHRHAAAPSIDGILVQVGAVRLAHARRESPQHYPDNDLVREHDVVAWLPPVPALGVRVFASLSAPQSAHAAIASLGASITAAPASDLSVSIDQTAIEPLTPAHPVSLSESVSSVVLDNGIVQVCCDADGVRVQVGARVLVRALTLESHADAGDSYTPSLRGSPRDLQLVSVRAGARGPLRASVRLRWTLAAESARSANEISPSDLESMTSDRENARRANGTVTVETELVLDADAHHLRCDVRGVNRRRDHRLRLRWNTDLSQGEVHADAAFGPVRRDPIVATPAATVVEAVPPTMPMHRWATVCSETLGASMISDGLAEAEIANGQIALTLLRAIGELSRADLPERPGHAGWPCATPRGQSQGRFRARVGLLLHGAWSVQTIECIEDACDALLLPLTGDTWRDYGGSVDTFAGPTLVGAGLRASAVTLSADGISLLLRVSNVTDQPATGSWQMPTSGPWRVTRCRLDETPLGEPEIIHAEIRLQLASRELHTLLVSPA